ncbi:MAG: hypothetical protein IH889_06155 [Planctomycetes bacterium]|nr:hypothetical protein [Planctomycetota bacterium]
MAVLLGLGGVLVLLVAVGPTLVSWGLGHGLIQRALQQRINGTVAFDRLTLAWFGSQAVEGFSITDAGGEEVVRLDVRASAGLFGLLTRRLDAVEIDLSGTLSGELREDGSTSFKDLLVGSDSDAPDKTRRGPDQKKPITLPGLPATTLRINGLTVRLRDAASQRTLVFDDLTGELAYRGPDQVTLDVHSKASGGDLAGTLDVAGEITRLFDSDGVLTLPRASGRIDIQLSNLPAPANDQATALRSLKILATSDSLAEGINVSVTGEVIVPGAAEAELIELDGTLGGLLNEQGAFAADLAGLDITASAHGVPTRVVDAFAGLGGMLVAAVGPRMDAQASANGFSRTTGTLEARVDTAHGWLQGHVKGRDNALRITNAAPIHAELEITPALRDRLLYKIHPVLADIRSTEQPLRATMSDGTIPLDGDVSRLNADLEITIGAVELDSGSVTLALLTLFNSANARTIPGRIDPIVARIRNGIVTYERFTVKIDQYTLVYSGRIDLNTRTVDLRTEIPLQALAMSFKELQGYADNIVVPLVTRGRFGKLKTELDPDFDLAKAALESGVRGLLNDALKDTGLPLGDLLDEILKKKRDRREP